MKITAERYGISSILVGPCGGTARPYPPYAPLRVAARFACGRRVPSDTPDALQLSPVHAQLEDLFGRGEELRDVDGEGEEQAVEDRVGHEPDALLLDGDTVECRCHV